MAQRVPHSFSTCIWQKGSYFKATNLTIRDEYSFGKEGMTKNLPIFVPHEIHLVSTVLVLLVQCLKWTGYLLHKRFTTGNANPKVQSLVINSKFNLLITQQKLQVRLKYLVIDFNSLSSVFILITCVSPLSDVAKKIDLDDS